MRTLVLALAAAAAASDPQPLSLPELLARARPGTEELAVEAELAGARLLLAETALGLAEGPTVALSAGARREAGSTDGDLELDLDWPLLSARELRAEAAGALAAAEALLPAAAALEKGRRVTLAFVEAWSSQEATRLRREDLATVERWLALARRRAEAGADPAYEVDLVALELEQSGTALVLAEAEALGAWAELAVLTEVPEAPQPLAEPPSGRPPPAAAARARFTGGALSRAALARATAAVSRLRLESARRQSRLALRSTVAREGEEEVGRLGLAYRFARRGERPAVEAELEREVAALSRQAEVVTAALAARFERALRLAAGLERPAAPADSGRALAAIEARLAEGKSRPAEALRERRGVLAARLAALDSRAAALAAAADLEALSTEVSP